MELYGDKKKERQPGMTATARYKRILLKLSGEALMGDDSFGINRATIERIVGEIAQVAALGLEIAVVIGGGIFFAVWLRVRREWIAPRPITSECSRPS